MSIHKCKWMIVAFLWMTNQLPLLEKKTCQPQTEETVQNHSCTLCPYFKNRIQISRQVASLTRDGMWWQVKKKKMYLWLQMSNSKTSLYIHFEKERNLAVQMNAIDFLYHEVSWKLQGHATGG
ncbi:hypothetical protein CEXT_122281 [Caerostris extrusa]|uniref:Uncharacterized protein n=1 Tax=Caerostris extrusa TaxID=172846 RepID=A0AAV4VIS6_CAEEX|nr:hypothetical protein CEXT_122281 [Caerostris extrusa]